MVVGEHDEIHAELLVHGRHDVREPRTSSPRWTPCKRARGVLTEISVSRSLVKLKNSLDRKPNDAENVENTAPNLGHHRVNKL